MITEVKILFNNIKNIRHLISEGVSGSVIIDAINNHEWIYLYYEGDENTARGYRTIRPYVLGTNKSNNKVLRAWQDNPKNSYHFDNRATRPDSQNHDFWSDEEGVKPGWRMFRVDKISKILPIGKKFHDSNGLVMIPAGYHEGGDDDMVSIEAYVSTRTKPDVDIKYDKTTPSTGMPDKDAMWDSVRRGNKNKKKITSNDVIKLRDIASKFHKKGLSRYVVVIDDKNNFQLATANEIKRYGVPETAIVGSLPYLYDSIVKGNAPADDSFFNDMKNKALSSLEQKKQMEIDKGFSKMMKEEENLPSIPYNKKTFFKT